MNLWYSDGHFVEFKEDSTGGWHFHPEDQAADDAFFAWSEARRAA